VFAERIFFGKLRKVIKSKPGVGFWDFSELILRNEFALVQNCTKSFIKTAPKVL
jgi:hypothetical protein